MMNLDSARAGDGLVSPRKRKEKEPEGPTTSGDPGPTEPVFAAEEKKLNIEVPEGWKTLD